MVRTLKYSAIAAVALLAFTASIHATGPGSSVITILEQQLGLNEAQVRGGLGALLVFAQSRLNSSDFNDLVASIPNAEQIMHNVKFSGTVTRPLDTIDDYEKALGNLGIGQPLAAQFAPAAVEALGRTGHTHERDILARVIG